MLFLKFMPWRSGFQGEFPVFRVPLNEERCSLKFIIPPPAVQGLMQCWGPPAWVLGCSTPSIPMSCSWESCFGANGFQPQCITQPKLFLCHPSDLPPWVNKPWETQPRWSCTNPVQLWFDPDPQPTSGWKIRKWLMFSMSPSSSSCSANHPTLTCTCLIWQLCCWDVQL